MAVEWGEPIEDEELEKFNTLPWDPTALTSIDSPPAPPSSPFYLPPSPSPSPPPSHFYQPALPPSSHFYSPTSPPSSNSSVPLVTQKLASLFYKAQNHDHEDINYLLAAVRWGLFLRLNFLDRGGVLDLMNALEQLHLSDFVALCDGVYFFVFLDAAGVHQMLIECKDGEFYLIPGQGVVTNNGLEYSSDEVFPRIPEPSLIGLPKLSIKVCLAPGSQGMAMAGVRQELNRLKMGTSEPARSAREYVVKLMGVGLGELLNFHTHLIAQDGLQRPQLPICCSPPLEVEPTNSTPEPPLSCPVYPPQVPNCSSVLAFHACHGLAIFLRDSKKVLRVVRVGLCSHLKFHDRGGVLHVKDKLEQYQDVFHELLPKCPKCGQYSVIAVPGDSIVGGFIDHTSVLKVRIECRDGELRRITGRVAFMQFNGNNYSSDDEGFRFPTCPEGSLICHYMLSSRVRLGHGDQWEAEIRHKLNWLNIGTFETPDGTDLACESVTRLRGGKDLFDCPRHFQNEYGSEQLQLPPRQGNDEIEAVGIPSEGTGERVTAHQAQVNFECLGRRKTKDKTPGGERRDEKTNGVGIANHLEVGRSTSKHNLIGQSCPNKTPDVVDQERIPELNCDTPPPDQALAAIVDKTSSIVVKDILPQFSLTDRQQNPDENLGNNEVGMVGEGIGEAEMEEGQLNSVCLGKRKRNKKIPVGERGNKKTNGVRIGISVEEIFQTKEMNLKEAAVYLRVSKSTLKRSCREHGIPRWPPRKKHLPIGQSCPSKSPTIVDQEQITKLSDALRTSNQLSANPDTTIVTVKARYADDMSIRFRLTRPWVMEELERQVKKRLPGNYYIRYKDEDKEWILMACDEDIQDCISSSSLQDPTSIEVFLVPK